VHADATTAKTTSSAAFFNTRTSYDRRTGPLDDRDSLQNRVSDWLFKSEASA